MKTRQTIRECCGQDGLTVEDDGWVRGVKILGLKSKNNREYTLEACRRSLSLYEGLRVNIDHPDKPNSSRSARDRFAKLKNVRVEADGLRGDLRYNPKMAWAEAFAWWAKNEPDMVGLSHNAIGEGEHKDGVFVVDKIVEVRSVDIVADPATTQGLYESQGHPPMQVKLREWLKGFAPTLDVVKRKRVKKLLEDGDYGDDMMEPPADDAGGDTASPEDALWQGVRAAILAILDSDASADDKSKKVRSYLKSHEKLTASGNSTDMDTEDDEEDEGEDDEEPKMEGKKPAKPSAKDAKLKELAEELDKLKAKDAIASKRERAHKAITEAKLPKEAVSDVFLESLLTSEEKDWKRILEDRRSVLGVGKPKSSAGHQGRAPSNTAAEFKSRLLEGVGK